MKKNETWYKVQGSTKIDNYELLSYELFEAGVSALEELESKNPSETIDFCFYSDSEEECKRLISLFPNYNLQISEEEARDWDQWWRDRAQPVSVSPLLWVRPPWVEFSSDNPKSVVLELEAKTAFGTGEHDTTASTACLMEDIDFSGKTVLDIGTGTGILAMFARRLGAKLAVGTEIDPLAIPCISENFKRNGFNTNDTFLGFLDALQDSIQFDVIVCNMIRSELWPLRADIEDRLASGGDLIISGQLLNEKHYIENWFTEVGYVIANEKISGEWWSVRAHKN